MKLKTLNETNFSEKLSSKQEKLLHPSDFLKQLVFFWGRCFQPEGFSQTTWLFNKEFFYICLLFTDSVSSY